MSRPTLNQLEKLVDFLEDNRGIARGHLRTAQARHQTKLKWEEVTTALNSLGGAIKDAKSWAKFWSDKKYALKRNVAQRNASATRTGGGVDMLPPISELDERILSLMGGSSFADGDQSLSIPLNVLLESQDHMPAMVEAYPMLDTQETGQGPMPSTSQGLNPPETQASASSTPRRSPRLRARQLRSKNQLQAERERLIKIEEKRVEAELINATGWEKLVQSLDNLANAIMVSGDKIAQALLNRP